MASAKDLKKRIKTTANTKKITRTMEMVATARSKRTQKRVEATTPYASKLAEILASIAGAGTVDHPLLRVPERIHRSALVVITGNRGLCGGYNANVLHMAELWIDREKEAGREVDVHMIGKKGIGRFRFARRPVAKSYTHIDDRPSFAEADAIAKELMRAFLAGELQRVVVISMRYHSSSSQSPVEAQLLPIPASVPSEGERSSSSTVDFIFEPGRDAILEQLLPLSVSQALFRAFLESAVSEQIARRIAMKLATDNAEEMIKSLTRMYNRTRQAGITQQITEIVTGAQALE